MVSIKRLGEGGREGGREILICRNKRGKNFVGAVLLKGWLNVQDANNNK